MNEQEGGLWFTLPDVCMCGGGGGEGGWGLRGTGSKEGKELGDRAR